MNVIKVGFLVSYDYELLKLSIPRVYEAADTIALAVDKDRRTWSGNTIDIPASFFDWLKQIDTQQKISIYEDDFYVPEMSTKENDTRERNMLAKFMGEGGWHVQVDADEYFADFRAFCSYLQALDTTGPVSVCPMFLTLFKKLNNGYLYVSGNREYYPVATNHPYYTDYRGNLTIKRIETDHLVIHDSWARTEEELLLKLRNWSHNADFNVESYFNLWKAIDGNNYKYVNNFHPFTRTLWKHLTLVEGGNIDEISQKLSIQSVYDSCKSDIQYAAEQPILRIIMEKLRRRLG